MPFRPPSKRELERAARIAPLPAPLGHFYSQLDTCRFGSLEVFQLDDYIEVNTDRQGFGELARGTFFASDLAEGWFFVDTDDTQGLGHGFCFWCDRGLLVADDCVPAAGTLIELLEVAAAGSKPWQGPTLGDRAVTRLCALLEGSPAVATRAPLDPLRFQDPGRPAMPLRIGDVLLQSNGFLLPESEREFFGIDAIAVVPGSEVSGQPGALWVGRGPGDERYASTTGAGFLGLAADRLLRVRQGDLANAEPLGRTFDVYARWIEEDEEL